MRGLTRTPTDCGDRLLEREDVRTNRTYTDSYSANGRRMMREMSRTAAALVVACAVVMMAGCSSPAPEAERQRVADGANTNGVPRIVDGSMVEPYSSTQAMAEEATHLVVGTVVGTSTVTIVDLLFTRYELRVDSEVAGELESHLAVYMVGDPSWTVNLEVPRHLRAGETYALFLQPTDLGTDQVGGDGYYIVGQGAWEQTSPTTFEWWADPPSDASAIPRTFEAAELRTALAAEEVASAR